MHDIHECSDEEVITTWMTDVLSLSGDLCVCVWVIGLGNGGGGGGIGGVCRTNVACRDAAQPRFGHIISSSCGPRSDYLAVPDVRKKCYRIPPKNELCLCEDIFQQHQAKLVNCDVEDAIAVESYKDPFDSEVCDDGSSGGASGNECCCGNDDNEGVISSKSSSSSPLLSSVDDDKPEDSQKNNEVSSVPAASADMALKVFGGRCDGQLSDKLTAEEREKVLQELDDIVTGNFLSKVRRFSQDVQSDYSDDHLRGSDNQQIPQLIATTAARLRGKRSSSLDTDEIINYGKVAELTQRFSRLGEASIIAPQHYCSEPNFFRESGTSVRHYRHNDDDENSSSAGGGGSSGDDYEVVQQPIRMVFIRPMSVSDDRLNKRVGAAGESSSDGGVVLTEVTSDGENNITQQMLLNATQTRRRSFRKSLAFDSSLSSIDCGGDEVFAAEALSRYQSLKGGWQSMAITATTAANYDDNWLPERRAAINYSKSSDTVSVSNLGRSHRRYSSVDVYDQVKHMFLDVEKTEKEFRDHLLAEKHRRQEAIQEYLANKELLLMKMKSASTGGILRWNQEHQDTLLDDEDPSSWPPQTSSLRTVSIKQSSQLCSSDKEDEGSPKDMLRRVLHTGLKGRRIRKLRKLESRSSGFALADLWRISKDESLLSSSRHSTGCSSAEPPDNHNNTL